MSKRVIASGFLATSDVVPEYGEAVLSEDDVRALHRAYSTSSVPMYSNHDPSKVIPVNSVTADLRRTDTGSLGVWIEVEIDEADWDPSFTGWSFGWFREEVSPAPESLRPPIQFGADPALFTLEEREALASLQKVFNVRGGRYYQFSAVTDQHPATVILVLLAETLRAVPRRY